MEQTGYKKLVVWQKAHKLVLSVYRLTKRFPKEEQFGLTSQMRRSAVSVPANIVEGYARTHKKESLYFYSIAKGSLAELEYYIDLGHALSYIGEKEHSENAALKDEVGKLLYGFMKSQKDA